MRTLLVCREGAPLFVEITSQPIRDYLLAVEGVDDPLLYQIWEVDTLARKAKAEDITQRFAAAWGREIEFADGIEASDYLAPFPAFVRAFNEKGLKQRFTRELAYRTRVAAEPDFVPAMRGAA